LDVETLTQQVVGKEAVTAEHAAQASKTGEVLVRVQGVSKRFCRSLKRSLWYGVQDICSEFAPNSGKASAERGLRPSEFWALDDVSFELRRGECLGLIGHNGAGKTTLLKMLTGLVKLDRGRIELRGRTGALIALGAGFNPLLTGRENVYVNGSVLGLTKREIDAKFDEIVEFAELRDAIDSPVQNYSSGMQVRLGFAVAAVLIEPDVLFLDEVLAVGDIAFKYKCFAVIERLMRHSAVVLVSHDLGHVQRICTSVMFLSHGRINYHGTDVAAGIQRYQASQIAAGEAKVAGTGRATISDVIVVSASRPHSESEVPVVRYGDDVEVHMQLRLAPEVRAVTVTVNLLDQAGVAVAQCNSADQAFAPVNLGVPIKVTMRLPRVPLSPGVYRLWIVARHRDRPEPLAVIYGAGAFQVVGNFVGYVAYQPLVQWHAENAAELKAAR
jgi:lipopolysaccharide transport system ATP-binding protein